MSRSLIYFTVVAEVNVWEDSVPVRALYKQLFVRQSHTPPSPPPIATLTSTTVPSVSLSVHDVTRHLSASSPMNRTVPLSAHVYLRVRLLTIGWDYKVCALLRGQYQSAACKVPWTSRVAGSAGWTVGTDDTGQRGVVSRCLPRLVCFVDRSTRLAER